MNVSSQSAWKRAVPIICTAFLALYFGAGPIFSGIKDLIQNLSFNDLAQYRTPLKKCVDEKTAATSGTKIFGLEYECAIDVGAKFYVQEPDKAIRLCKKFYPLPVNIGADDFSRKYEDNLQTSVCRVALERRMNSASSTSR